MDADSQIVLALIQDPARKDRWLGLVDGVLVTSERKIGNYGVVVPEDCDDYFDMILADVCDDGYLTVEEKADWFVDLVHEEAEVLATQHLYN